MAAEVLQPRSVTEKSWLRLRLSLFVILEPEEFACVKIKTCPSSTRELCPLDFRTL